AFRNIIQAVSDAEFRQHQIQFDGNLNPGALLPAFKGPRISFKRTTMFINYQATWLRNNTDGAFAIPATGDLNAEWGPAANDVRQRVNVFNQGQNLTNQANQLRYSGTLSSPFFGRPTTVREMRKIDAGINFSF